jgi:hypothetical protein
LYTVWVLHLHIHVLSPSPSHSHWHHVPKQDLFHLPVLQKRHFWLFKIASQGVPLWHIHVHIHIYSALVHFFYFSSFYLSPLFMVAATGLKTLYSFLYREHLNHIHLLNFLLLHTLSHMGLLSMTCFSWQFFLLNYFIMHFLIS